MNHNDKDFSLADVAPMMADHPGGAPGDEHGPVARATAQALAAIAALRARRRLRREFEALSDSDALDRMLAEAQLTRADIEPMLANYPASGHLIDEMVGRLDIADQLHADATVERDLRRVCTVCHTQGQCQHWLKSGATQGYEAFCPNADQFTAMRAAKRKP